MENKKKYRIAIDINDVLRDFTSQFISVYTRYWDSDFEIDYDEVTDSDFTKIFPFKDSTGRDSLAEYHKFIYEDYPYELYARAQVMERGLISALTLWLQNDMKNFGEDENPELLLVSPFETNLSIQSTLSFLSKMGCRFREIYFPADSSTVWDKCDLLITANPLFLDNKPEGKKTIKITAPYNKECDADYTFDAMSEVIRDKNKTLIKIVEEYNNASN